MSLPRFGHHRRSKPRVNVRRGYHGNETTSLTHSAVPKAGEGIESGMVISLDSNGQWVKGAPKGKVPFIAFHDQEDTDVVSSGKLLGLSCAGDFEIETGHFVNGAGTYNPSVPLTAGTSGNVGYVTLGDYDADADILGIVSRGRENVGPSSAGKLGSNSTFGTTAGPNYTLTFVTRYIPARKIPTA